MNLSLAQVRMLSQYLHTGQRGSLPFSLKVVRDKIMKESKADG